MSGQPDRERALALGRLALYDFTHGMIEGRLADAMLEFVAQEVEAAEQVFNADVRIFDLRCKRRAAELRAQKSVPVSPTPRPGSRPGCEHE